MVGTTPYFYLIPITSVLAEAVAGAVFPLVPTIVHRFIPPLQYPDDGFRPLANRDVLFRYFEAFKVIVVSQHCFMAPDCFGLTVPVESQCSESP